MISASTVRSARIGSRASPAYWALRTWPAGGDFDGDGIDEVVIGVPDAPVGGNGAAGIVYVTRVLDPAFLFVDGFEDDGTASRSPVAP